MLVYKHWSLKYLKNKILNIIYAILNPEHPWLTSSSIKFLDLFLDKQDSGFEFGSGKSTVWLAKRVKKLTNIERKLYWYKHVKRNLVRYQVKNTKLHLVNEKNYFSYILKIKPNSLDFCLVDDIFRDQFSIYALNKLKPGGLLIIDNAERYLPSNSNSPERIKTNDITPLWLKFLKETKNWKKIWTTNGVFDTLIIVKPQPKLWIY